MNSKEKVLSIPAPRIQSMKVKIVGTSPLIFHRWSEKATKMILDKQMKKPKQGREVRDPKKEYEDSFYKTKAGKIAIPALWIKQSMISAGRFTEVPMTIIRGAVFVVGDTEGFLPLKFKTKRMRQDQVKIGMGTSDLRFRGEVQDWSCDFIIKYNQSIFSAEQVLNLLQTAGFSSGLGEWRMERGGVYGGFEIDQ